MARRKLYRTDLFPYHITSRVNNRENFPIPLNQVWKYFSEQLAYATFINNLNIHAFVLMPNHFHLLASTPHKNLDIVMRDLLRACAKITNIRAQRTGHLFEKRYYWNVITNPVYYSYAFKYVYRNPIKAGFCMKVEQYKIQYHQNSFWTDETRI